MPTCLLVQLPVPHIEGSSTGLAHVCAHVCVVGLDMHRGEELLCCGRGTLPSGPNTVEFLLNFLACVSNDRTPGLTHTGANISSVEALSLAHVCVWE